MADSERRTTRELPFVVMIDDEPENLSAFTFNFGNEFRIKTALSGLEAWPILRGEDEIAVVVADQKLPGESGLDILTRIAASRPFVHRILLTAYVETDLLIDAINRGVLHRFVSKPWDYATFKQDIIRGIESYTLARDNAQLRDDLAQAGKLAAIGEIASGIVHDLAQPLAAVKGYVTLLDEMSRNRELDPAALAEGLRVLRAASDSMDRLISHLRDFARRSSATLVKVQPESVLENAILLVGHSFSRAGIEFERDFARPLPELSADPQQLEQLVLNLLVNARDACAGKPLRRVRLSAREDSKTGELVIEVADTGGGIAPEIAPRIFEAFFTTKPAGKGTGLGLSLVRTIVARHRGSVSFANRDGGAVFEVRLPLRQPAPIAVA